MISTWQNYSDLVQEPDFLLQKTSLNRTLCTVLFFLGFALTAGLFQTPSMRLLAVRRLQSVVGLNYDNWFSWRLFLVFEARLLQDLAADDPIVVGDSTLFAFLSQKIYQSLFSTILVMPHYLCLFDPPALRQVLESIFWAVQDVSTLKRGPSRIVEVGLSLEDIDFVLETVVYFLLFFGVEWSFRAPWDLSIRWLVHVEQFWWIFYFSLIHASFSSVHFLVTFISVRIRLVLSAFIDCLAVKILPVIGLSSALRLLTDSDLGLDSIIETLPGYGWAMGVFSE
jgi:hypothetical protein